MTPSTATPVVDRLLALERERDGDREPGALCGVRVLDLSRVVAAPFAAMAMAEMGASVLKIERPGTGDDTRAWGPPFFAGEGSYYLAINANKLGLTLDLADPEAQAIVRDLALRWADVLVENYKPGTLERWNLALADLREANPRLITATVRGNPEGDDRLGYDFIIQATSGLMSLTGPIEGPNSRVPISISDLSTGQFLLSGILACLYERSQSGRGQHLGVSLWESQVALMTNIAHAHLNSGREPRRVGNDHPHIAPYGLYACADGDVALAATNDRQFRSLAHALERPEIAQDPRFSSNDRRVEHRDEVNAAVNEATAHWDRATVIARLEAAKVACGPVRTIPEVFASPEARLSGIVSELPHSLLGRVKGMRLPWRFSRTPSGPAFGAPALGEHDGSLRGEDRERP